MKDLDFLRKGFDLFGSLVDGNVMKSDFRETDKEYIIDIDLPGVAKEDIKINYEDEYLTIAVAAKKDINKEDKYIYRERTISAMERSYYVGDIKIEEIKAKLDNGVLVINVPKKQAEPEKQYKIVIE